jgi:hypothetical protein
MTLEKTLRQQLNKAEPGGFHVSVGDWTVGVFAEKSDSLSCALKELALDCATPVQEDLDTWATRVARSTTGLLEALRVVEVDAALGKALLRSDAPTLQSGKALYYEVMLERTTRSRATLHRYAGQVGEKREPVTFTLTHDAVVKIVTSIVG